MYLDPFSLCKNKAPISLKLETVWFVSIRKTWSGAIKVFRHTWHEQQSDIEKTSN